MDLDRGVAFPRRSFTFGASLGILSGSSLIFPLSLMFFLLLSLPSLLLLSSSPVFFFKKGSPKWLHPKWQHLETHKWSVASRCSRWQAQLENDRAKTAIGELVVFTLMARRQGYNKYRGQVAVDFALSVCLLDACQGTHVYLWAGPFQLRCGTCVRAVCPRVLRCCLWK